MKILLTVFVLLFSFSANANEKIYYCKLKNILSVSTSIDQETNSPEVDSQILDGAFFIKINEENKLLEFSEDWIIESEKVEGIIESETVKGSSLMRPLLLPFILLDYLNFVDQKIVRNGEELITNDDISEMKEMSEHFIFARNLVFQSTNFLMDTKNKLFTINLSTPNRIITLNGSCTSFK